MDPFNILTLPDTCPNPEVENMPVKIHGNTRTPRTWIRSLNNNLLQHWKSTLAFLRWRFPAAVLVYLIFRLAEFWLTNSSSDMAPAPVTIAHIEIKVDPPKGTYIDAACFYNHQGQDDLIVFRDIFESPNWFKWPVYSKDLDGIYYCDATHGNIGDKPTLSTRDFPIFGDGVPKKNSTWMIDLRGRRRIVENGVVVDDHSDRWHRLPHFYD